MPKTYDTIIIGSCIAGVTMAHTLTYIKYQHQGFFKMGTDT